ncbi:MAG: DUF4139 domain-containing protein [Chitinispirillaceae bacterium]
MGEGELKYTDIASQINPVSVYVKSLSDPEKLSVIEQNYVYDLISDKKLLEKYEGKKIKIIDWNKFKDRKEVVDAELLSSGRDGEILRIDDEIYLGHPGYKVLPQMPDDLVTRPTLFWKFRNNQKKNQKIEVSYLTSGLKWNADYTLLLSSSDGRSELCGWVTVDNRSGASYDDAELKLVAGDLNRVAQNRPMRLRKREMMDSRMDQPEFSQENLFEYHAYDLGGKTTLKNNQTKQIRLLGAPDLNISREYVTVASDNHYWGRRIEGEAEQPVQVNLSFLNNKKNGLGIPLPSGTVRLYTSDSQGKPQFIGEDLIDHTSKNERVTLKSGNAFDIEAKRVQTDYTRRTSQLHESEWTVTIKNHKEKKVKVGVVERARENWEVVEASHEYEKIDAASFRFDVTVPENGEVKVKYKLRVGI